MALLPWRQLYVLLQLRLNGRVFQANARFLALQSLNNLFYVLLLFIVFVVFDGKPKLFCSAFYTSYKTYPNPGITVIDTQNHQAGTRFPWEKWNVECLDGQALVGISSDRDFLDIFRVECRVAFPDKPKTGRFYPFYENCAFRNASRGVEEFYCYDERDPLSANSFVTAVWEDDFEFKITNWPFIPYVGQALKCCSLPQGYQLVYESCFYRWTHNEFWAYYDEINLPVKCPEDTLMAGMGWVTNPIDEDQHWDWLLCCPYWRYSPTYIDYYVLPPVPTSAYTREAPPNITTVYNSNDTSSASYYSNASYAINQYIARASHLELPVRNPSSRYNLPEATLKDFLGHPPREQLPSSWLGAKNQYYTQKLQARTQHAPPSNFPPRRPVYGDVPQEQQQSSRSLNVLQARRGPLTLQSRAFDDHAAMYADDEIEVHRRNLVAQFRSPQMYPAEPKPLTSIHRRTQPRAAILEQKPMFDLSTRSADQARMFNRITGFYAPGYVVYSRRLGRGRKIR